MMVVVESCYQACIIIADSLLYDYPKRGSRAKTPRVGTACIAIHNIKNG